MLRRRPPERVRALTDVRNPGRVIVGGFVLIIVIGTVLLSLPVAAEPGASTSVLQALFTAVSATCVTGLIVVDTPTHFSLFGEIVILVLIQIGGTGVMTLATLIGVIVNRRIGMRMQATAQAENKALGAGDVRALVRRIALLSVIIEAAVAAVLTVGFARRSDIGLGRAIYDGIFHSVSAFNNAGFSTFTDNLMGFAGDPLVCVPVMAAVVLGGIGFPVLVEIERLARRRRRRLGLHSVITLGTTAVLLVAGTAGFLITESTNSATMGGLSAPQRVLAAVFGSVVARTAGFNSLDVTQFRPETLLLNDILMFIGGGSAGTAGGIKVTTFALLAFVVWAELRGEPTVHVRHRRLPAEVQRQALTVVLLAVGLVMIATMVIMLLTPFSMAAVLFEVISAFATVGLSAGLTAHLPAAAQLILILLMFVGRLGPVTLGSALALRDRQRRYEYPQERPLVG